MPVSYAYDPTGTNPDNHIGEELHPINEANYKHYYFIVPKFAPFFASNVEIRLRESPTQKRDLHEGIDYYLAMPFVGASRSLGVPVYGGIVFNLAYREGIVEIDYNTLGGDWVADPIYVLNFLANKAYNPRQIYWDQVTNVQETFPPNQHTVNYDDITGQGDVIQKLRDIETSIINRPSSAADILILKHRLSEVEDHILTLTSQNTVLNQRVDIAENKIANLEALYADLNSRIR